MGVVDKLNQIKSCKDNIKQAIIDKGVDMTDVAFTEYADKIYEIQSGGGSSDYIELRENMTTYINNDLTEVGNYIFANCHQLSNVRLPNCVSIGHLSFQYCENLSSINISNVQHIGDSAFQSCQSLKNINLPKCEYIGGNAFFECRSLTSIELPECKDIQGYAFAFCENIQSASLPKCEVLGYNVFHNCDLSSIDLPKCWKIESESFCQNHNLKTADLPICERLQGSIFAEDENLTSVIVPHCFFMLGETFRECQSLTELDLSKTYTCYLENVEGAFYNTPLMNGNGSIYIHAAHLNHFIEDTNWSMLSDRFVAVGDPDKPLLTFEDGRMYGDAEVIENNFQDFLGISKDDLIYIDLPNVNRLYKNDWDEGILFNWCNNLQEASFSNAVSVSNQMFYGCSSLTSVNLPKCEKIGDDAFHDCGRLTSIDLPECKEIGYGAFNYCSSLTSVNLPKCEKIGDDAFNNTQIKTLTVGTSISTVCEANWIGLNNEYLETIYVPSALVEQYKSAQYWWGFADKIVGI